VKTLPNHLSEDVLDTEVHPDVVVVDDLTLDKRVGILLVYRRLDMVVRRVYPANDFGRWRSGV